LTAGVFFLVRVYRGELALQQGAKAEAARLFRLAAADCPKSFIEYGAAIAELKGLDREPWRFSQVAARVCAVGPRSPDAAQRAAKAWCAADPGSYDRIERHGSRLCGAALHAAPRPGQVRAFARDDGDDQAIAVHLT
jgi:hypothetical protein